MQTTVPLTRSLLSHDGENMVLEFDVPAQPEDANPPIFIGVLLTGNDMGTVADAADRLVRADIIAVVHLERIEQAGRFRWSCSAVSVSEENKSCLLPSPQTALQRGCSR